MSSAPYLAFALVAACGGPPEQPRVVSNQTAKADAPVPSTIGGIVLDAKTRDGLADAVVVITGPGLKSEITRITDAKGAFSVPDLSPGQFHVQAYFSDLTFEVIVNVPSVEATKLLIPLRLDMVPQP